MGERQQLGGEQFQLAAYPGVDQSALGVPHRVGGVDRHTQRGGPGPKRVTDHPQLAKRADMALAVSLVIVLQLVNIVAAPLWARAVVTGASVSASMIIKDLLILVLVPLVLGLAGHARYTEHAEAWKQGLEKISNIALYLAIATGIAVNWSDTVSLLGSWVLVAATVMILVFMGLGALIGLKDRSTAISGAMVTGMRFQPIGLIIITTQLSGNSAYLAPALVFALIDTFLMFGIGIELGRRAPQPQPSTSGAH